MQPSFAQVRNITSVKSPDGKTIFRIGLHNGTGLQYNMSYKNKKVMDWSALGLHIDRLNTGQQIKITGQSQKSHSEKISWPLGEDAVLDNTYREVVLHCMSTATKFDLVARVFNGSIAFRYIISGQPGNQRIISKEDTEFNLAEPAQIYQYKGESVFRPFDVNALDATCDLPATLVTEKKLYISIGEAENQHYTKAQLVKGEKENSLAMTFNVDTVFRDKKVAEIRRDSILRFAGDIISPWRTVSIAESAIGLHDFSQLYLKLVTPLASTAGKLPVVKPGKLIRAQLTTQSGLDCIDFAAAHNFQYIMFDAGWYGAEFRTTSDPTKVIAAIDMPAVIAHGKEKGIGVILYVNYVALRSALDTILPLYKSWGVSGLKFGFVDGLTQEGLSWLDTAIKKVNDAGFVLDIHDNYKPTGLSRKYPFLLTQEGIRGDENSPDAFHTTVLPFTRFLAGPADFTFCYPNSKNTFSKNIKVSMAQQLALTVVYFSPLQSIFWYGNPNDYTNEEEIEFFKKVPTVWDESHYLAGEIGQYISVARRKGSTWFIGNAAGLTDWSQKIALNFLTPDKAYTATIYEDDGHKSILKRTVPVKKGNILKIDIKAMGGQAIVITPVHN